MATADQVIAWIDERRKLQKQIDLVSGTVRLGILVDGKNGTGNQIEINGEQFTVFNLTALRDAAVNRLTLDWSTRIAALDALLADVTTVTEA